MEVPLEKNPESSAWNPQSKIFLFQLDSLTQGQLSRRPLKNNGRKDEQWSQIRYVIISIKGVFRYRWLSCIQSFRIYHKNIRFLDRIKIIHLCEEPICLGGGSFGSIIGILIFLAKKKPRNIRLPMKKNLDLKQEGKF